MRVEFSGLKFDLPQGWIDITEDLPVGAPPSLARSTGVGALQFSIAKHRGGEEPNVTIESLRKLLDDFCARSGMRIDKTIDHMGKITSVSTTCITGDELISATYLSNGRDIVLATYVCQNPDSSEVQEDLSGVEEIIKSLDF